MMDCFLLSSIDAKQANSIDNWLLVYLMLKII